MPEDRGGSFSFHDIIAHNPTAALILMVLSMSTWLIGGNILVAFHFRRRGLPMWSGLIPFRFRLSDFNATEWLIFAALLVVAVGCGVEGVSISQSTKM